MWSNTHTEDGRMNGGEKGRGTVVKAQALGRRDHMNQQLCSSVNNGAIPALSSTLQFHPHL